LAFKQSEFHRGREKTTIADRLAQLGHGQKKSDRPTGLSQSEAAEMLNVGRMSVKRARQGSAELAAMVERGDASVSIA
jgi:hypothetical protein